MEKKEEKKSVLKDGEIIGIGEILNLLPHRYPFLMIDKVVSLEKGKSIIAVKNTTINEPFFQGHFPGYPVMPGVLILEALAQAGGILAYKTEENDDLRNKLTYFMGIDKARFRKPILPGYSVYLKVELIKRKQFVWVFSGKAEVEGNICAEAELMATFMPK
ncbi:MAG: 3-hydroxyacyl-ACP dehydratase FabZ [Deltaproteobacteria bacterium]|jgi:3-hydroxyacyl-[acyl-carrier-protein] dehydratase|uniref:3-hydroxyacyl-[acyl-carrier-protein] dehydratase FabZ n=1 Tax=Candidatus Acidulodesulfobacterium acidiphilum TaxID=2597224 RepID=A0A520XEE2_9DELT|nr:3-hydroxyacyl-ACP dehydratase FabZ [Deltaproteobacteria bacterium]RZV39571.1 MAG: 3-hydroxyacyl-ACP dehydratase FabZ [Candidatus Acidulodesulfobacterium acidiphilum]